MAAWREVGLSLSWHIMPLTSASLALAMCSVSNVVSTFSGKTKHSGRLQVLLMLIFTLFSPLERSRVVLVIRLLGCRLPCKVFALYALHADSSHFCCLVCTRPYVTAKFSSWDGDQNRILTAVLDLSVMQQQLVVLYTTVFSTKGFITLLVGRISFQSSDNCPPPLCC